MRSLDLKPMAAFIIAVLSLLGYTITDVYGGASFDYDLVVDDMPVNFNDDVTMRIDTQTNDRGFVIYNDYLLIRSPYLTYWDFNETYEHEDVNLVNGSYCYAYVPAENLTLNSITEINRFRLSSWNGTVSVQCSEYGTDSMILEANSTDNATLLIRAVGLHRYYEYRVLVDSAPVAWVTTDVNGAFEYNYTADWSNHTIQFVLMGGIVEVPNAYLTLVQIMLCLAVALVVLKSMVLPLAKPDSGCRLTPQQMMMV